MSTTLAHRHHVQIPSATIVAVLVAVVAAAGVLVLINRPDSTPIGGQSAVVAPASVGAAAAVALPESPALRHQLAAGLVTTVPQQQPLAYSRNHVEGATLAPASVGAAAAVALPESPALRHQLAAGLVTTVPQEQPLAYSRNHVEGADLAQ